MKVNQNLHSIWISEGGELPSNLIKQVELWRKTLPNTWSFYFWCNVDKIRYQYLSYLSNLGVTVLDIKVIMSVDMPGNLKDILEYLLPDGCAWHHETVHQVKLFSDIFRMLLMSLEGLDIFSGIYLVSILILLILFQLKKQQSAYKLWNWSMGLLSGFRESISKALIVI